MKKWNTENKIESFSALMDPVIEFATKILKDTKNEKDIPYEGYAHENDWYEGDYLGYAQVRKVLKKEKKWSPLQLMLELSFNLGFQQGKRHYQQFVNKEKNALEFIKSILSHSPTKEENAAVIKIIDSVLNPKPATSIKVPGPYTPTLDSTVVDMIKKIANHKNLTKKIMPFYRGVEFLIDVDESRQNNEIIYIPIVICGTEYDGTSGYVILQSSAKINSDGTLDKESMGQLKLVLSILNDYKKYE